MQSVDSKTKIKICGVKSEAAFDAVAQAGADFVGFVFHAPSPRFVSPSRAAALSRRGGDHPLKVGLFVEPASAEIAAVLRALKLDILQIYGDTALCAEIRAAFGLPVWQAVGVAAAGDLPAAAAGLDGLVIEAKAPAAATRPGGNGILLERELLRGWAPPLPWLLAGGLDPENVARAVAETGAPGVDVSSGVEIAPGEKSPALIHEFVRRLRPSG